MSPAKNSAYPPPMTPASLLSLRAEFQLKARLATELLASSDVPTAELQYIGRLMDWYQGQALPPRGSPEARLCTRIEAEIRAQELGRGGMDPLRLIEQRSATLLDRRRGKARRRRGRWPHIVRVYAWLWLWIALYILVLIGLSFIHIR